MVVVIAANVAVWLLASILPVGWVVSKKQRLLV